MLLKKYFNYILFGVNILVTLGCFGYLYYYNDKDIVDDNIAINQSDYQGSFDEDIFHEIHVEVKGAVTSPGVYKLYNDQIINDAISLAGGFKKDAYTTNINLSKHLEDEMLIYVYTKNEYAKLDIKKDVSEVGVCQKEIINMCINEGESIIVSGNDISVVNSNDIVNINTASKEELTKLNGIGDAKAKAIIDYRNANGPFSSIEDILKVSGISQTIYDKIKNYITI